MTIRLYIKYIKDHEDERLLYTVKHYKICYFVPAALVPLSNYNTRPHH